MTHTHNPLGYLDRDCPTKDNDTTAEEREAAELGRNAGTAAGSWVVDGNSSEADLRGVLKLSDDCELDIPAPFSGEWADGLTLGWLSDELGVDEESDGFDDLVTIFEDAYYQAYEDEATRSARAMLPEEEE